MSLEAGQRIGPYEVLSPIGVGGMGEVYRARDAHLDREVALKVLPDAVAQDPDRLLRFEREARVLASLDHPNIATVHGLEKSEGSPVLVMELVPGDTLQERLARGALPIDEALALFRQIAEALEAAHDKGVVHRDLKPANIKITPDGKVKVLDFGLAKALSGEPDTVSGVDELSQSPTAAFSGTRAGMVLGTASYMSPEQARGIPVDKRADLWSFGCVLYEALTGKKAFEGETATDIIASVVKNEPVWAALPVETPWRVRDLVKRCLRKNPAERLRDASAARLDIDDAREAAPQPAARQRSGLVPVALAALLAATLTFVLVANWMRDEPRHVARLSLNLPGDLEVFWNRAIPVVSPDGNSVVLRGVHEGASQLFLRRIDRGGVAPIAGTENGLMPFFSPDSKWLAFSAGGTLKRVPVDGGAAVDICACPSIDAGSWGEDGTIVFASIMGGLMRVPSSGGTPQTVTTPAENEIRHRWPRLLPGGAAVLFSISRGGASTDLAAVSLSTGERTDLSLAGAVPHYASSGHLVFGRADALRAVPFDPETLEVKGTPRSMIEGISSQAAGETFFSLSREGTLLYVTGLGDLFGGGRLVWVDRNGKEESASEQVRNYVPLPSLSPDGRFVALALGDSLGSDIWILEIGRDVLTRLTFEDYFDLRPQWSPDGAHVFFPSNRATGRNFDIFRKPVDGSADEEKVTEGRYRILSSVSSDGNVLIFREQDDNASIARDIGMVRLDGDSEPVVLLDSEFAEHSGVLSPDDRWLAYVSDESGLEEVYVRRFPDLGGRRQVSTSGGTEPVWSTDGTELFYRNGELMMAVAVSSDGDGLKVARPVTLFEGPYASGAYGGNPGANYDVSSDGRFLMIRPDAGRDPTEIHVVLNWIEELKEAGPLN